MNDESPINEGPQFKGGQLVTAMHTAGGHQATSSERPAFPDFHRKIADPSAFAFLAMGATFCVYAVNLLGARGVYIEPSAVPATGALGSAVLFIATILEFISGATFPATMFGVYSGFFAGFCVLNIGWFGLTGSYDGTTANVYSGKLASELDDIQGLWLSTFVVITFCLLVASTRQSAALVSFLTAVELFCILRMVDHFVYDSTHQITNITSMRKASSAFAFLSGIISFYLGAASLLTKESSFFTLPTGPLSKPE